MPVPPSWTELQFVVSRECCTDRELLLTSVSATVPNLTVGASRPTVQLVGGRTVIEPAGTTTVLAGRGQVLAPSLDKRRPEYEYVPGRAAGPAWMNQDPENAAVDGELISSARACRPHQVYPL